MKRTLIVMGISISSLSFAVYTQTAHLRKTGAGSTAMEINNGNTVKPLLFHEIRVEFKP
jgi:hypothetical protein